MKCFNKLCVYQRNKECVKEDVEIDWRGNCMSMVNVRLTKETLDGAKLYTKLILEHNDNYYFDDTTGEFIYSENENCE